ncbi:glycosyltransferase 87 family protein [Catellatospora sp. KI3]|uniref:glycosyltransferase 87 family protein n=1 Tax=Catellatospora sp. KI3 TaxID=3041620 RepID=UPI00248306FA|nr:glycosyltransferase 87 family protein [Catellatospora sp. KI3]MDI1465860.1 glycosyltransferase 87 family protein [Catellatospora sp. KI3]
MLTTGRARLLCLAGLATAVALFIALVPGHRGWFDVSVYYGTVDDWVHAGGGIYDYLKPGTHYGFTYPPFAAVAMLPMSLLGWHTVVVVHTALTAAACAALVYWLVDPIAREHGWSRWFSFGLGACALAMLQPARDTVSFGQVNLLLVALVWADVQLLARGAGRFGRWAGVGIGLAAAVKLTPAVFIVLLLLAGRRRAAATAAATAAAATAVAALVAPAPSLAFWTGALWQTSRVGDLAYISNQSLLGALARLRDTPPDRVVWLVAVVAVLVLWAWRVRRAARAGDLAGGFALTGLVACLVSPITWVHHLVWAVPALAVTVRVALSRPAARRRRLLWGAGTAYVILCSSVVWLWWYHHSGLGGLLGGSAYVWVTLALLVLMPVRPAPAPVPVPVVAGRERVLSPAVHAAAERESVSVLAARP